MPFARSMSSGISVLVRLKLDHAQLVTKYNAEVGRFEPEETARVAATLADTCQRSWEGQKPGWGRIAGKIGYPAVNN
jgi:hypothetical protein